MNKKKSLVLKLATFLVTFATTVAIAPKIIGCVWGWAGEPELPARMNRKDE